MILYNFSALQQLFWFFKIPIISEAHFNLLRSLQSITAIEWYLSGVGGRVSLARWESQSIISSGGRMNDLSEIWAELVQVDDE